MSEPKLTLYVTNLSVDISIAKEMGYRDFQDGYLYNENPYSKPLNQVAWDEGWEEAFIDKWGVN